uniref:Uncharacterized protein n=1 Tax=Tanacetum cinerariifolium TaxID=118510 RepID=A0A6L2MSP6_TANCI|nr:hypothetical protein [Tanacetum cinerariifolium]
MEPILGMRYETAQQLKMALANYGVVHGCQLLYMKNDWRQVLVYYGRNVVEGRCAVVKKPIKKAVKRHVNKKPDSQSRDSTSQEQSFQIKSLISEHKRCRNYNLGSLVTYKWIDMQYFKEIIKDTFMPLRKMRDDIRQKLMIDYRQALLDLNSGSTCTLDVVESDNGFVSFKRMYICFKRVKDGWLAGCRKVIGLDGCFLKHTCKGELLTAIGMDVNNQMYPIAWAVRVVCLSKWILRVGSKKRSSELWCESATQVFGSNIWKKTNDVLPLPPIIRKILDIPQKAKIKSSGETSWSQTHNLNLKLKKKTPGRKKQVFIGQCASRGGGRSGKGDGNDGSGSGSGVNDGSGSGGRGGG